ncbi:hypothetical protein [Leptolyngbya sp. FACHB-261]|uniref:hypothetical protein n=1 Tax=Leptolyngbya sp. FACHB-261 TaxID=2692806 RepID=UPI001684129E|nr:hypothetical protein [Leptolyngbya sp. FACHB-261]MBD2100936.1 hypothetical protein [Leptolyngbya sp. FACHB-261]
MDHPDHHPAQGLQVADILPGHFGLTHKLMQRIIKTGSGWHCSALVWLLVSLNQPPLPTLLSVQPLLLLSVKQVWNLIEIYVVSNLESLD